MDLTTLETVWFLLICVLWLGFFVLEGFDFGVGMLVGVLGRNKSERRALIHSIGPVWDGNEVWLLTAGGATFAAFPDWYASTFSGFYLALFLVLAALIVRGVAFEFWGKHDTDRWRTVWERALGVSSLLAALLFGVAWANFVKGVEMNAQHDMTSSLLDLLSPYALLGGLVTLSLFLAHGALFLALRTRGELEERAKAVARPAAAAAAVLMAGFVAWTLVHQGDRDGVEWFSAVLGVAAVATLGLAPLLAGRRPGLAFGTTVLTIVLFFCALFSDLYPAALPADDAANTLWLADAASQHYTLKVMTWVAVLLVPVVMLYQGWSYWVFRARLSGEDFDEGAVTPEPPMGKMVPGPRTGEAH
jgi:cytochrome d ubiquinol oxidase subunit II